MKIYTYSQAREKLADILKESKKEEVVIRRRKGAMFSIVPKSPVRRSPFYVAGLQKGISRKEVANYLGLHYSTIRRLIKKNQSQPQG